VTEADASAELAKRAEEANLAYEQNTALRSLVVAIPGIGSSLDIILASEGPRIYRERILKIIEAMQEHMQTVEDRAIDKKYLKSEEFFDLILKTLDSAIKTRDESKLRLLARILTESTIRSKREGYSPEEYLDLIADLTPRELMVARALYRDWTRTVGENLAGGDEEAWRHWQDKVRAEVSIDRADLQLILGRLRSTGLVTEMLHSIRITPLADDVTEYWVSPSFEKLMRFLELRG
jgi:hypothetical protein